MTFKPRNIKLAVGLTVFIGVHLFLLSRLIFFPYPELFIYSYLTDQGLLPYKQIFDQHFPGLMFFPINLHTLGMTTPQTARIWHFGVISIIHLLIFLVAKRLFKSDKWAFFTNLLYLIWQPFFEGYVLWIDLFVPIFLLSGFYYLQKSLNIGKNLFLAGFFIGIALLFKQVTLPLILLVAMILIWRVKKINTIFGYLLGIGIPVAFLIGYIVSIGVWEDFVYWTLTFNLTTFAQLGRKLPSINGILKILPVFGSASLITLFFYYKDRDIKILWLGVFFFASLAYAYARFDYIHLQPALPFAILLIAYFFSNIPKREFNTLFIGLIAISVIPLISFYRINSGNRTLFFGEFERNLALKVEEITQPDDKIFSLATTPHLYQMTNRLPPGNIFVFQFPWFMKVAENKVLSSIIKDPPKVVVRDKSSTTGGLSLIENMENIDDYIDKNYFLEGRIENTEILLRK